MYNMTICTIWHVPFIKNDNPVYRLFSRVVMHLFSSGFFNNWNLIFWALSFPFSYFIRGWPFDFWRWGVGGWFSLCNNLFLVYCLSKFFVVKMQRLVWQFCVILACTKLQEIYFCIIYPALKSPIVSPWCMEYDNEFYYKLICRFEDQKYIRLHKKNATVRPPLSDHLGTWKSDR